MHTPGAKRHTHPIEEAGSVVVAPAMHACMSSHTRMQNKRKRAREVARLVVLGERQDLEHGEEAELAAVGVERVQEGLAAVQQGQRARQAVRCTQHSFL